MSAPGTVKARSSIEVDNSCNGPFCCFGKKAKKHRKHSDCDKKVAAVVSTAQLQIVTPEEHKPIPRAKEWEEMPSLERTYGSIDVSKQVEEVRK